MDVKDVELTIRDYIYIYKTFRIVLTGKYTATFVAKDVYHDIYFDDNGNLHHALSFAFVNTKEKFLIKDIIEVVSTFNGIEKTHRLTDTISGNEILKFQFTFVHSNDETIHMVVIFSQP